MRPDGSGLTRLTDSPDWETTPDWSPDGTRIVYSRKGADDDDMTGDLWMMNADGSDQRMVLRNGTAPQFVDGGRAVVFERDRVDLLRLDLRTGRVRRLTPPPEAPAFPYHMIKPRLSPDGSTVAFISDKQGKWHAWAMGMDGAETLIGPGCQPAWDPDGRRIFYVAEESSYGETSLRTFAWPKGPSAHFLKLEGTWRHVYFPTVSDDGRWLLFAACPAGQHDHASANYQLFLAPADGGPAVRLTSNGFTDRWPRLSSAAR
jgi:Tol biopolymer transport system component